MLYIAFSRVKRRSSLKVLLPSEKPRHSRDILWKEVLEHHESKSEWNSIGSYTDNMEDFNILVEQLQKKFFYHLPLPSEWCSVLEIFNFK